jgi:hypothetical protein
MKAIGRNVSTYVFLNYLNPPTPIRMSQSRLRVTFCFRRLPPCTVRVRGAG